METNAKIQWTWVVISKLPKRVSRSACKDFGMQVFMDGFAGARVFFSVELANKFRLMLKADMKMNANYYIRVVSDFEFMRECEEYLANRIRK